MLGWDTDQFPTDLDDVVRAMLIILGQGGLGTGGLNFDAKLRRGSTDLDDLFHAHIGGMDTFARGLVIAQQIIDDGVMSEFINSRYAGYNDGIGAKIAEGATSFAELDAWVREQGEPAQKSGKQEMLENIYRSYF